VPVSKQTQFCPFQRSQKNSKNNNLGEENVAQIISGGKIHHVLSLKEVNTDKGFQSHSIFKSRPEFFFLRKLYPEKELFK